MQRHALIHHLLTSSLASLCGATVAVAQPRLTVEPHQPAAGSLIRLTIDRLAGNGDSVVGLSGAMAAEPVHFRAAGNGRWQALAAIPVDASDSIVASVTIIRASKKTDSLRAVVYYPHHPPPIAQTRGRAAAASRLRVDPKYTRAIDSITEARIEHENALAHDIGHRAAGHA